MSSCELCGTTAVDTLEVSHSPKGMQAKVAVCEICQQSITTSRFEKNHWQCLHEAIWHESPAVKVLSFRILNQLKAAPWAVDLIDQIQLDESELKWAKAGLVEMEDTDEGSPTKDSNGTTLLEGDSVTLIKDLEVKGAGFTAKRGTLVKGIRLTNNPEHVDARVNGIQIVLVAKFLKKV